MGVAFAVRLVGFEDVLVGNGEVIPVMGDPYYYLRLAVASLAHFPAYVRFDPYLGFPDGSPVPWSPLFTLMLATVARVFGGGTEQGLLHTSIWIPPIFGALTTIPVFASARRLRGTATGIGAALVAALTPYAVGYSSIGYVDHHCLLTFLGATTLWLAIAYETSAGAGTPPSPWTFVGLAVVRSVGLLAWNGGLLFLALCDAPLVVTSALRGKPRDLFYLAASVLASAFFVASSVYVHGTARGGRWSAVELSHLTLAALAAEAALLFALALWERVSPGAGTATRLARVLFVGLALAGVAAAHPGVRTGIGPAITWLGRKDAFSRWNPEQQPLVSWAGGVDLSLAMASLGGFALLLPVAPLLALWIGRRREHGGAAVVLLLRVLVLGALAMTQVRFTPDWTSTGAVVCAIGIRDFAVWVVGALALGDGASPLLAAGLGAVLVAPGLSVRLGPAAVGSIRALEGRGDAESRVLETVQGSLVRFAQEVRRVTPETSGYLGDGAKPEYGIIALPAIAHSLHYPGRRAAPANPFGPFVAPRRYQETMRFFAATSEEEAFAIAADLQARYVVSAAGVAPAQSLLQRLHQRDGTDPAGGSPLGHFRLITEGPRGGRGLTELLGARGGPQRAPYKLFEIVRGAVLELSSRPGEVTSAEVELVTPCGRHIRYVTRAAPDEDGIARLRLPYATEPLHPVRALGLWRVTRGAERDSMAVSEDDVLRGATLHTGLRGAENGR